MSTVDDLLKFVGEGRVVEARARELAVWPLIVHRAGSPTSPRETARVALLRHEARHANACLHAIPSVILKGPDLADRLFGSRLARTSGDIDLLVERRCVHQAIAALRSHGWTQESEFRDFETNNQIALTSPRGVTTELHWAVALPHIPQPPPVYFMDRPMRAEPLLIYLAFHFHNHVGFLKGLIDIAAWVDKYGDTADWAEIHSICRGYGIAALVSWPLRILELISNSKLKLPQRDPRVDFWAGRSVDSLRGILSSTDPIAPTMMLGYKTEQSSETIRVLNNWLSLSLIDRPDTAAKSWLKAVFIGPTGLRQRSPEASRRRLLYIMMSRPLRLVSEAITARR